MMAQDHPWLERLSAYHSGGVSTYEQHAVEQHVATCLICQEALTAYRRLYALASSPLRLGKPTASFPYNTAFEEPLMMDTDFMVTNVPNRPSPPRSLIIGGLLSLIILALFAFTFVALRPTGGTTHPPATVTPGTTMTPGPTTTATSTQTPSATGHICANPANSSQVYAYRGADQNVYMVRGCATPVQLTRNEGTQTISEPLLWGPSNRYLVITKRVSGSPEQLFTIEIASGKQESLDIQGGFESFGFLDDHTMVVGRMPTDHNQEIGATPIIRIDLTTGQENTVATISWFSQLETANGIIYYAGYRSSSENGAWLHALNPQSGADQQVAYLGKAFTDICQVYPCHWTAPWDVSRDGKTIVYHDTGPDQAPSDIYTPPDTPLFVANVNGTGSRQIFSPVTTSTLTTPYISPQGALIAIYVNATGASDTNGYHQLVIQSTQNEKTITLPHESDLFRAWRTDGQALVVGNITFNGGTEIDQMGLFDVNTEEWKPLEPNTAQYTWGY